MWISFSLLAAFFFSIMFLVFKKIADLGAPLLILGCSVCTGTCFFVHLLVNRMPLKVPSTSLLWLALAGFLSYVGNYFQTRALNEGPNPGYTTAIVGCQSVILLFASYYLFGSQLSLMKVVGVVLCMVGVVTLSLSE
jgi:drug/metabolite transporter (DMT)-like permease